MCAKTVVIKTEQKLNNAVTVKFLAIICAVMIAFALVFCSQFILAEEHHDCVGEDCPICSEIAFCQNAIDSLSFGFGFVLALSAVIFAIVKTLGYFVERISVSTPTSLKVKMLN